MASPSAPIVRTPDPPADIPELDNDLWRFALSFYGREGVSSACLVLQEKLGVDVNILLFVIFARLERGVTLDTQELAAIDGLVRGWRTEIVQVLRQVRTRLKSAPFSSSSSATEDLRNRIKADELSAEQIELVMLAGWLERQPPRRADLLADAQSIPSLVARYFAAGKAEAQHTPDLDDALRKLARAIDDAEAGHSSPT
jgi:uncharacterized protein (TIGR02444 family)